MTSQTATARVTAKSCSPEGRVTKSLLGYGPLAGAVFVGSIFTQGLTRRGFSASANVRGTRRRGDG